MAKKRQTKKQPQIVQPAAKKKFSLAASLKNIKSRYRHYREKRSHRSFRLSRRRDYVRKLELPGYWSFTLQVFRVLGQNKRVFLLLIALYSVVTALIIGIASQDTYTTAIDTMREASVEMFSEGLGSLGEASVLFLAAITGGLGESLNEAQQAYSIILGLLLWLTTVGILRVVLVGKKPILRDVLYSAGGPIVATFIVLLVLVVQFLPLALALLGYAAATASGLIAAGGVAAMLFWFAAGLLALISVYWVVSSLLALVIVTLPGMYPFHALSAAGELVYGRRLRLLLRTLWMAIVILVAWIVTFIPIILLDMGLKELLPALVWLPIVPVTLLVLSAASITWAATYVYLLYRKVVDNDAAA